VIGKGEVFLILVSLSEEETNWCRRLGVGRWKKKILQQSGVGRIHSPPGKDLIRWVFIFRR
jgi:hypothetical protein